MTKNIHVEGMMCKHCAAHVEEELKKIDGVISVDVSLEKKQASVTLNKDVDDQALFGAIKKAGYNAKLN